MIKYRVGHSEWGMRVARGFETALWQAWRQVEAEVAEQMLERAFGYVALELHGGWMPQELLGHCPVRRRLRLAAASEEGVDACMELESLGVESGTVDVVLLPHTLEYVASPQAVLREVDRILVGEGHVLVTGFNPWSAWTAARFLERGPARGAHPLAAGRLCDWLQLLGFEVVAVKGYFRRPPINAARMLEILKPMENWPWLPLPGCGYAVLARKHVYGMTPLKLRPWERKEVGGFARPAMRNMQ